MSHISVVRDISAGCRYVLQISSRGVPCRCTALSGTQLGLYRMFFRVEVAMFLPVQCWQSLQVGCLQRLLWRRLPCPVCSFQKVLYAMAARVCPLLLCWHT